MSATDPARLREGIEDSLYELVSAQIEHERDGAEGQETREAVGRINEAVAIWLRSRAAFAEDANDYPALARAHLEALQLLADAYDGFGTDAHGFPNGEPTNSWRAKVERLGAWPRPALAAGSATETEQE